MRGHIPPMIVPDGAGFAVEVLVQIDGGRELRILTAIGGGDYLLEQLVLRAAVPAMKAMTWRPPAVAPVDVDRS